jgi:hypothetical protein
MHSTDSSDSEEIKSATESILQILKSHNVRRRPSLEVDISNRPCSEIDSNTDSTHPNEKVLRSHYMPNDIRPLTPSFLVEFTPSPHESPRPRNPSLDHSLRIPNTTSSPRANRRKSTGDARGLGSRSEVFASATAISSLHPPRRSCDAQHLRQWQHTSVSRPPPGPPVSPGRAQRFNTSALHCTTPERPRAASPAAKDRDFLRSIAPLPLPAANDPAAVVAPPPAAPRSHDCRRSISNASSGGPDGSGSGKRRRRLWSRLLGCLGSRCGGD